MDINLASNNMTSTFPIGTILPILFSNPTSPPTGWLLCDGSQFSTDIYPDLAEKVPSGILPDLRDYVLVGAGNSYAESQKIGASTHTIDESEMPSHQHFGVGSTYNNVNGFWESSNTADGVFIMWDLAVRHRRLTCGEHLLLEAPGITEFQLAMVQLLMFIVAETTLLA